MKTNQPLTRRSFLRQAGAAVGGFTIVPRHVLGGALFTAPSDQLTKAVIGVGGMGRAISAILARVSSRSVMSMSTAFNKPST